MSCCVCMVHGPQYFNTGSHHNTVRCCRLLRCTSTNTLCDCFPLKSPKQSMSGCSCPANTSGVITDVSFRNSAQQASCKKPKALWVEFWLLLLLLRLRLDFIIFFYENQCWFQQHCSLYSVIFSLLRLLFLNIGSQQYLSFKVKGQAGDAVRVNIFEDGHSLHSVGVPHTDVRLLAHLPRGHQHTLRMQS